MHIYPYGFIQEVDRRLDDLANRRAAGHPTGRRRRRGRFPQLLVGLRRIA